MSDIIKKIKKARIEAKMSQSDVADEIQNLGGTMTQSQLSRLEQGKNVPLVTQIEVIADALGMEWQLVPRSKNNC